MKPPCGNAEKPPDDDGYFEEMSKAVFRAGFNWEAIEKKWPDFKQAFQGFSVETVAQFGEEELDRLMRNRGIVRNGRKITAVLQNARVFLEIRASHGSFSNYLETLSADGEAALCRALSRRFKFIGGSTAFFFLQAAGKTMPETTQKWEANAAKK
ncbi:MAG: DNA-3-methyladenine glycosylase I [Nitrospiria bacterium]